MPISNNNSGPNLAQPQQEQPKGSGFVNLGRILGANVNNRLSSTIDRGLNQGSNEVKSNLQQIGSQFQDQSNQSNLASDANKQIRDQALQNIGQGNTNVDDKLKSQFEQFRSGQYAGPTELDPTRTAQVSNKAQELQSYGKALQGGGDKSGVLQAFAGKGNYTQGQQKLDSLLLGKGPNAEQNLADARKATQGLGQQINQQQNAAQQTAQLRQNQAQQFGKDTNTQLNTANTGINTDLQNKLSAAQANQAIYQKLANGENLNPDEIAKLNGPQQFQTNAGSFDTATLLQNLNALKGTIATNGYQNFNTGLPTQSSVVTPQDLAKLQALSSLSGAPQSVIGQEDQVGKYQNPNFDVNSLVGNTSLNQYIQGKSDVKQGTPGYGAELDKANAVRRTFGLPPITQLSPMTPPGGNTPGQGSGNIRLG